MKNTHNVVFIVAHHGYQSVEYEVPKKILSQAGITVMTASNKMGAAQAHDTSTCSIDMLIEDIPLADVDAVCLVGGPGALDNLDTQVTQDLIKKAYAEHKIVGAICISPRILAKSGILEHKKATGWDDDHELGALFATYGVTYERQPVVVDGTIITATGPHAAAEYGHQLVHLLATHAQ